MATQKKIDTVKALTEKVSRARALILADYRGLKHKQFEQIKKLLKKTQADLVVAKNRLVSRALGDHFKELLPFLKEPTAVLFAYADEVAPLRELLKFFKNAGAGKPKAGLLGNQLLSETDIARLAALPTREILLGQLVGQLKAPISGLHNALNWNIRKLVYAVQAIHEAKSKQPAS